MTKRQADTSPYRHCHRRLSHARREHTQTHEHRHTRTQTHENTNTYTRTPTDTHTQAHNNRYAKWHKARRLFFPHACRRPPSTTHPPPPEDPPDRLCSQRPPPTSAKTLRAGRRPKGNHSEKIIFAATENFSPSPKRATPPACPVLPSPAGPAGNLLAQGLRLPLDRSLYPCLSPKACLMHRGHHVLTC